jgi:hypothetical protein
MCVENALLASKTACVAFLFLPSFVDRETTIRSGTVSTPARPRCTFGLVALGISLQEPVSVTIVSSTAITADVRPRVH